MGHSSVPCLSQEHPPALKLLPQALAVLTDPILLAPSFPPASEIPLGAENQERNPLRGRSESTCPSLLEELGVRSARCCEMRRGKPFAFRFLGGSEASPGAAWARCFQLLLGFAAHRWHSCGTGAMEEQKRLLHTALDPVPCAHRTWENFKYKNAQGELWRRSQRAAPLRDRSVTITFPSSPLLWLLAGAHPWLSLIHI